MYSNSVQWENVLNHDWGSIMLSLDPGRCMPTTEWSLSLDPGAWQPLSGRVVLLTTLLPKQHYVMATAKPCKTHVIPYIHDKNPLPSKMILLSLKID